jgi:3-methyladenine DNA glycosylase AlkC
MAEQLKTFFSPALVRRLAQDIERVAPSFSSLSFIRAATTGLADLELIDRGKHIAHALAAHLPPRYPDAIQILLRSLGPEHSSDELKGAGMAPFYYLPHTIFVAEHGLDHFELSLRAQYELTKRFSAEWSIRSYIARDPERTLKKLTEWTQDKNAHVRRLASEGTRTKLPWATRVPWLDHNPERIIALLTRLKDDPSTLVRRSVANSLNDLSKTHASLVIETCRTWLKNASPHVEPMMRHALRSLVKQGHRGALRLLSAGARPKVTLESTQLSASVVRIGEKLQFSFDLVSTASRSQELLVDYAVYFIKANGEQKPKVFKLKRTTLAPRERARFESSVSFAPMTTRKHYPGIHRIDVLINGEPRPLAEFKLQAQLAEKTPKKKAAARRR